MLWKSRVFFVCLFAVEIFARVDLQNVKCILLDPTFAGFDYCYFKDVNRTYKYISLRVKLLKVPVTNVTVSVSLKRKINGDYVPFLYNTTFDACKFLKNRRKGIVYYFHSILARHTNMDHPCPFDHDLTVEKFDMHFLNNGLIKMLPTPDGLYGIYTEWRAYNVLRARVNGFFELKSFN